jgi:hypothetical protein
MVNNNQGDALAKKLGCVEYLEVGTRSGQGIEERLLDQLFYKHVKPERPNFIMPVNEVKKKKKKFFFF